MKAPKEQQTHAEPAKGLVLLYRKSAAGRRSRVELFAAGDGGSLIMVGASVFGEPAANKDSRSVVGGGTGAGGDRTKLSSPTRNE